MRAVLLLALVACTPDVVPGSYYCGPDAFCPDGQSCRESDNTCVLAGLLKPFECEADVNSEPDDRADTGYTLPNPNLTCTMLPTVIDGCLFRDDPADWIRLAIPADCGTIELDARITYPVAFQQLGLSLVDTTTGAELATDTACTFTGDGADDLRCLVGSLTGGVTYAIGVAPTGEGDCDGDCAFNRYTLRAQLK